MLTAAARALLAAPDAALLGEGSHCALGLAAAAVFWFAFLVRRRVFLLLRCAARALSRAALIVRLGAGGHRAALVLRASGHRVHFARLGAPPHLPLQIAGECACAVRRA
jgi:hypothetical protein